MVEQGEPETQEAAAVVPPGADGGGGDPPTRLRRPDPPPIPERVLRMILPRQRVRALRKLGLDRRGWRQLGLGFLGLVLVGAALLWLRPGPFDAEARERWERLNLAYHGWYGRLTRGVDAEDRATLRELGLGEVLADLGRPDRDPRAIADVAPDADLVALAGRPPRRARTLQGVNEARSSLAAVDRVWRTFARWPVRQALEAQRLQFAAAGWDGLAGYLGRLLDAAPPRPGADPTAALQEMRRVAELAEAVLATRLKLRERVDALAGYDDPVLQRFVEQARALDAPPLTDSGGAEGQAFEEFAERQQAYAAFGVSLLDAVQSPGYAAVDRVSHRASGPSYAMLDDPRADPLMVYRTWLSELEGFSRIDEDWRPAWGAEQERRLGEVEEMINTLAAQGHPGVAELRGRLKQVGHRLQQLVEAPLVQADRAQRSTERVAIEAAVSDLQQALGRVVQAGAVDASIRGLREIDTIDGPGGGSAAVNRAWRRYRDQLIQRAERDGDVAAMSREAAAVRDRLERLLDPAGPDGLPAVPGFDPAAVGDAEASAVWRAAGGAAERRREAALAAAVGPGLPLDEAVWRAERQKYVDAIEAVGDVARWAEQAADLHRGVYRLDAPGFVQAGRTLADRADAWRDHPVLDDGALAAAVAAVRQRLDALAGLTGLSGEAGRQTLVALAGEAADLSLALGAWRRLAEVDWPSDAASLDTERRLQDRLAALARQRLGPAAAVGVQEELQAARLPRWRRAAEASRASAEAFGAVAARLEPMQLRVEALPPRLAFDVRLWALRERLAAAEPSDQVAAATRVQVMAFIAQARTLDADPAVRGLLNDLEQMIGPGAAVREDVDRVGPAAAGWRREADTPPGLLVFLRGSARLVFRRVPTPAGAVFVQTRELAVGDVQAMLDRGGPSRQVLALLRAGTSDTRWPGPRAWRFADEAVDGPVIEVNPRGWLASGLVDPHEVETGTPAEHHPITHVSAEAAAALAERFGCALPTAEQWLAAYRMQPPIDAAGVNRRDEAWARYAKAAPLQSRGDGEQPAEPTAGVFIPERGVASATDSVAAASYLAFDDGVVWLAEPDDAEPGSWQHLVGNAAEWVSVKPVNAAPLFDSTDGRFQDRVASFRRQHADAFAVIGGSFLSPPTLPLDEPLALDPQQVSRGFADVGLRLAFTPNRLTPTDQLIQRLAQQPYLGGE